MRRLIDIAKDPGEHRDLAAQMPDRANGQYCSCSNDSPMNVLETHTSRQAALPGCCRWRQTEVNARRHSVYSG